MASESESSADFICRAKGFSFDVQAMDLATFFAGCDIKGGKSKGVHFLFTGRGKSRAEAFIEFREEDDLKRALQFHKKYLGERYVDVVKSTREEMEKALAETSVTIEADDECRVIKLTGMPFNAQHDDVASFFAGADIAGGKKNGIFFLRNDNGTAAGSCYVEFITADDVKIAFSKDKAYMGNRFCHVSKSSVEERDQVIARQNEVLQNLREPILKLKGLPFKTTTSEIKNLFKNLDITTVEMVLNELGNCRGEAFVEFGSLSDAKEAIKFYKLKLLHRFVDVTKSSKNEWLRLIPETTKVTKTIEDLEESIVRMNGLPLNVTKDQIEDFFFGLDVLAIQIVRLARGACNGEAFVEFQDLDQTVQALGKNKSVMADGNKDKIIEVVASSRCDWRKDPLKKESEKSDSSSRKRPLSLDHSSTQERFQQPRMTPPIGYPATYTAYTGYNQQQVGYGDNLQFGNKEYLINMVGLPFSATEEDVKQFFYPTKMTNVEFLLNERGQPRGIAVVGFYSEEDRAEAMKKNKNSIGSRYVNLHIRNEGREYPFDFTKGGKKQDMSFDNNQGRYNNSPGRDTGRDTYNHSRHSTGYSRSYNDNRYR